MFVTKVEGPDGKVLFQDSGAGTPVINPQIAQTETEMLKGVIRNGTGTNANIGRPAAGKTGTTTAHADAWFVGYTPQYTTGVWMGDPTCECSMVPVLGAVFGGKYPALMWANFMRAATTNLPALDFTPPNRSLWSSPQFIDETGRSVRAIVAPPPVTLAQTVPPATTPVSTPAATTPKKAKPPKPAKGGGTGGAP
jgi:penicillin-binding protein 1A